MWSLFNEKEAYLALSENFEFNISEYYIFFFCSAFFLLIFLLQQNFNLTKIGKMYRSFLNMQKCLLLLLLLLNILNNNHYITIF